MATITFHGRDGQALRRALSGSAADAALGHLGIAAGRWTPKAQAITQMPQLVHARELHELGQRFGIALTDRVRQRPGSHQSDPRDHHSVAWPEQRHEHIHDSREVRVLLRGRARYLLRAPAEGGWARVVCEAGDWLALPPGLPHSFEASAHAGVDLLRLFERPGAWQAVRTASHAPAALQRWEDEGLVSALAWAA